MTESNIELFFSLLVFVVHTLTKISYIHSDQTPSFCVYRKMAMLVMMKKCLGQCHMLQIGTLHWMSIGT